MSALLFRGIPYGSEFKDNRRGRIRREEVERGLFVSFLEATLELYPRGKKGSSRGESGRGIFLLLLETHASREIPWPLGPFINKALAL